MEPQLLRPSVPSAFGKEALTEDVGRNPAWDLPVPLPPLSLRPPPPPSAVRPERALARQVQFPAKFLKLHLKCPPGPFLGRSKSNLGWAPLHLACYFGHRQVVQDLLQVRGCFNSYVNSVGSGLGIREA